MAVCGAGASSGSAAAPAICEAIWIFREAATAYLHSAARQTMEGATSWSTGTAYATRVCGAHASASAFRGAFGSSSGITNQHCGQRFT